MGESVEAGPFVLDNPLDVEQIYSKAQNEWLSQPEICQILQNHKGLHITSAPNTKPPSGSLFLFDKKVQKNYRNDGHNWKKKKNGKTLLEGHRRFEVKGFGNLNCYYARGEENRKFLRRCYWMPERDFSHIVLVHYLEETSGEQDHVLPADSDGNLNVEGKSIYSSTIRQHILDDSFIEENVKELDSFSHRMSNVNFVSWEDVLEDCTPSMESLQCRASFPSTQSDPMGELLSNNFLKKQEFGGQQHVHEECQLLSG